MNKRALPTLADVAETAQVSTATVSRCLNEPDKVSKETKEKVLEAVERLNYTPNFGARAIAANRTGIFGAVIPTMENAIFARGVEAFQKTLVANNATMLVASSDYDPEQEKKQIRALVARGADGLLLIGIQRDPETYFYLNDRNIPVVSAWATSPDPERSYVGFDNFAASQSLVKLALSKGHKSFGYISAPMETNDRASARVSGAKTAIQEAGLDPDLMHLIETDYSVSNGRIAARRLVDGGLLPSVIFCGNDVLATGVIQELKLMGYRIPHDVSVTGFDDIELASVIEPGLTTVHVPHSEMGRISATTLLSLVNGEQASCQIILPTHVVERQSLGTAPQPSSQD